MSRASSYRFYSGIDTSDATADTHSLALDKTAYVNGAKITGVAKGYSLHNMIANGNFASGYTGWTTDGGSLSVVDGVLNFTANARWKSAMQIVSTTSGHKYYWGCLVKGHASCYVGYLADGVAVVSADLLTRQSSVYACSATSLAFGVGDGRLSGYTPILLDNFVVFDLTTTFGAGNEWTAAQIDALLAAHYPDSSYFDGTLNFIY